MSWLSAVTGKAENFLNSLDKSAADAFHEKDEMAGAAPPVPPEAFKSQPTDGDSTSAKALSPSQSVPSSLYSMRGSEKKPSYTTGSVKGSDKSRDHSPSTSSNPSSSQSAGAKTSKKDSDEALFDFLNSKESSENAKKKRTPISSRHHSRQSSTSSIVSSTSRKSLKLEPSVAVPVESAASVPQGASGGDEDVALPNDSPTNSHTSADMDVLADAMKESPAGSDQSAHEESEPADGSMDSKDRKLSSLELENRLLRNEVASLNQEMITALKRAKDSEAESLRVKERYNSQANSTAMQDQLVRELQSREVDLTEALNAKDSQLAVLRVRLEEADKRISTKDKSLEEVRFERERILKDHSDSSGMHGQALDAMKIKLEEVESSLRREQDAYKQAQREAEGRQNRLQQEQQTMTEQLKAAEKTASDEKAKATEVGGQLKSAKVAADAAKKELTDYKDKAARILQSKERLINSLREGGGSVGDSGVSMIEHEALRQEKDLMKEELQQMKLTVENLRQELQDMENQLQQDSDTSQDMIKSLEDTASEEKRRREDAEQELLRQKQELQYALDELHKQKSAFQSRMNDREADIERLRNQLMTKSMSSSSETELESRVRSLTESLIQKQTILEALSTEKNSLVLQLERMEQQHRDLENAIPRQTTTSQFVVTNDHDDDVRQRLPMFFKEVPSDHEVTRRVKRAASSIDKFSIRLGVFLRRYPAARVFVILYMGLLHLWVLVVMMTYQPEMHGTDFQPAAPADS